MPCRHAGRNPDILAEPILRPGSWIGGDRGRQSQRHRRRRPVGDGQRRLHGTGALPAEITKLGQELSMSARLVTTSVELRTLAEGCDGPARADEPYRRAQQVVHGRLSDRSRVLDRRPEHLLDLGLEPYGDPDELLADLDTIDASRAPTAVRCWPTTGCLPA